MNLVDGARVYSLFNPLVDFDLDAHPVMSLAEELEPSHDAMAWTIRVKPDIEFHNGKTLSAEDVLFTFQRIVDPKSPALGALSLKALDIANAKKLDKHTVQIPCHTPFSPPEGHPGLVPLLRRAGGLRLEAPDRDRALQVQYRSPPDGRAPS